MLRYVLWFVAAGTGIAITIVAISSSKLVWLQFYPGVFRFLDSYFFFNVTMTLWPSSILMMAAGENDFFTVQTLSVLGVSLVVNAIMYGALGALVWIGVHKYRLVLYFLGVVIIGLVSTLWSRLYLF